MTPYDLERILRSVKSARKELKESGFENTQSLAPLICTMLETLLQHEADKAADLNRSRSNGDRPKTG
jgi:hypothetical protein